MQYNKEHGITPETIRKAIRRGIEDEISARKIERDATGAGSEAQYVTMEYLAELEREMLVAAENLEFERAAGLRDRITDLQRKMAAGDGSVPVGDESTPGFAISGRGERGRGKGKGRRGSKRGGSGQRSKGRVPRPKSE